MDMNSMKITALNLVLHLVLNAKLVIIKMSVLNAKKTLKEDL